MKIKYEIEYGFERNFSLTKCPNGNDCNVHSPICCDCNFYKKKRTYKNEIICTYDKYHKEPNK